MFFKRFVAICLLVLYGVPAAVGPHWHKHHLACTHQSPGSYPNPGTDPSAAASAEAQGADSCCCHQASTSDTHGHHASPEVVDTAATHFRLGVQHFSWNQNAFSHDHFNFGFTGQGIYDVSFTIAGMNSGAAAIPAGSYMDTASFRFFTGAAVPEPGSLLLLAGCALGGLLYRRRNPVAKTSGK